MTDTLRDLLAELADEAKPYDVVQAAAVRGRRRRRLARVVPAVAVVVAAGVLVGGAVSLHGVSPARPGSGMPLGLPCQRIPTSGPPAVVQSEGPVPRALSEDCGAAIVRLNRELAGLLADIPGATLSGVQPDQPAVSFVRQTGEGAGNGYLATLTVTIGAASNRLTVISAPVPRKSQAELKSDCEVLFGDDATCVSRPDGSLITTVRNGPDLPDGWQISDTRPDGTAVTVMGASPMTVAQATAIAIDPGLTLFP